MIQISVICRVRVRGARSGPAWELGGGRGNFLLRHIFSERTSLSRPAQTEYAVKMLSPRL